MPEALTSLAFQGMRQIELVKASTSAVIGTDAKLRVTLYSFCNMYSLFVGLLPSIRFRHHRFQRETDVIIVGREIAIVILGRLDLVGIQSTIGNLGRFIAIIHLFNKDGSIIAFLLNLVSHTFFIHDTPKIILSVHAHHVLPASHIFVDFIIVFASQIHWSSDIQEARNHVSLAATMSRRIGCKLLSQALIRREEESFCLHLIFKPHNKSDTFLLLKGVELGTSAMPNHHRFTILIHHLGSILRVILPITKPVLEVGSTDGCPLFCIQFGLLTIRSSHIGSVCLGTSHNLLLFFFQRESDITLARIETL